MDIFFNKVRARLIIAIAVGAASLMLLPETSEARGYRLQLSKPVPVILRGQSVNVRLLGNSTPFSGNLVLNMVWVTQKNAANVLPEFNKLEISLKKGSRTVKTMNCYSAAAPSQLQLKPRCIYQIPVTESIARASGDWILKIANKSKHNAHTFAIPGSSFIANCPPQRSVGLSSGPITIPKSGGTRTQKLVVRSDPYGIKEGTLRLRGKWHALNPTPVSMKLKIELLKPNGQVAVTGNYYSYHARSRAPRFSISYYVKAADAALSGDWKLRVTNYSGFTAIKFNIEREGSEIDPLVPSFKSTFLADCLK